MLAGSPVFDGAAGGDSFGGSEDAGMAAVVAGAASEGLAGGKYVVVPLDESCVVGSAMATGTLPAQQIPNSPTPRRRSALYFIIPRLAPMGERRGMPTLPTLREPSSWRKNA